MKVVKFETFLTNAGLRNYLFVALTTDDGLTGYGEASLEWQERTVQTILHEWAEQYIIGASPFKIEDTVSRMIRDQYQGGATVMTAISAVEIALWDLLGKALDQPVSCLLGGPLRDSLKAYANGWYGGVTSPEEYGTKAKDVLARGYSGLKFDPFGVAWKTLTKDEFDQAVQRVGAVRESIGPNVDMMIEFHGRLTYRSAFDFIRAIEEFDPYWCEEPLTPDAIEMTAKLRSRTNVAIAGGERLYTLSDLFRLMKVGAVDYLQLDVAHCGGFSAALKAAHIAEALDVMIAPHCSIGPIAMAATLQFDAVVQNFLVQENFSEYDVPWRKELVGGWEPCKSGFHTLPTAPGLGVDLVEEECANYPYVQHAFPSLWDDAWTSDFTQNKDRRLPHENN